MRRIAKPLRLLIAAIALSAAASAAAGPLLLVTEDEVAREAAAPKGAITPKFVPGPNAPKIAVLAPSLGGNPLSNPIRIEVSFASAGDAEIDPASFRAYYGALRIDLTERIVKNVKVEKSGLTVDNAAIPKGSHRLILKIADTKERAGETELRFAVE